MSLNKPPFRVIVDTLASDTLTISAGLITIKGFGYFNSADVIACSRSCPTACTKQVTTIVPVVPTAPCECPWNWQLVVRNEQCTHLYRIGSESIPLDRFYDYQNNNGLPTANDIIASVLAQINGDPFAIVTAAGVGGAGTYTSLVLTEKDCDSDAATCGFKAYITNNSGTVTYSGGSNVAHVNAVLSASALAREAPIKPGDMFGNPQLLRCGTYCKFHFEIQNFKRIKDDHIDDARLWIDASLDVWINSADSSYNANWYTDLVAELPCFA